MMERLCRLHDAIEDKNVQDFRMFLDDNLNAKIQISPRRLAGLMVIAAEANLIDFVEAILIYNDRSTQKLSSTHIIAVLDIIEKSNILSSTLLKHKERLVN